MNDWPDNTPRWRQEGRTGPNGPRYASRRDRAAVRRGGSPGKPPKKKKLCPMIEAVVSVKRGNYRLARRYAVLGVHRLIGV